jgi:hypothetical protein
MDKHEQKYCPSCNAPFTCKVGDIANCGCTRVKLSDETRAFLAKTHFDCLCPDCLSKVNDKVKAAKQYRFPTQKEMFIEGLHYYREGNYTVFTELYHLLRGYCCGNGCRHCVYGFKKGG